MPESSPSQRHSAPAGCFKMRGAEHDAMEQQLFSALSIFFLTPPPPEHLLHHCSATTNSSAQISCKLPIQTSASLASAPRHMLAHKGHTSADLPRNNTYPPRVAVQHARRCCIDICSMICIETDRASVCVWPNSCWRERLLLNSTPSKNGTADVHQLNDKLLICFSTLLFTSVLFRSESVRPLRESAS